MTCKELIHCLSCQRGKSNEQKAHHSRLHCPSLSPYPTSPGLPPQKETRATSISYKGSHPSERQFGVSPQLILKMRITSPFYFTSLHGQGLLSRAQPWPCSCWNSSCSEPHFLWLQLQVPPGQAGSFLLLGAFSLARRPPSPPTPQLLTTLCG